MGNLTRRLNLEFYSGKILEVSAEIAPKYCDAKASASTSAPSPPPVSLLFTKKKKSLASPPPPSHSPGTEPLCIHILHLQHAILHLECQRDPASSFTRIIYTNKVLLRFGGQSRLNLCGPFMYCPLTVPLCPAAIGPGSGYNVPGVIEAD